MRTFVFLISIVIFARLAFAAEIVADDDAKIKYAISGKVENLKRGDVYSYSGDEPLYISGKEDGESKLSVLLIQAKKTGRIQISLPALPENKCSKNEAAQKAEYSEKLNEYTLRLFQIQKLIGQEKTDEARNELSNLQTKYAEASSLEFLAASLDLLKGQRDSALFHLKKGLEKNPNYPDGQSLLKLLTTGKGGAE